MLVRPHDRESPQNRRTVAPLEPILEHQRRLTVGNAIRQRGNRKLRQVQLILPAWIGRGRSLVVLLVKRPSLFDRLIPLVHPRLLTRSDQNSSAPSPVVSGSRFPG